MVPLESVLCSWSKNSSSGFYNFLFLSFLYSSFLCISWESFCLCIVIKKKVIFFVPLFFFLFINDFAIWCSIGFICFLYSRFYVIDFMQEIELWNFFFHGFKDALPNKLPRKGMYSFLKKKFWESDLEKFEYKNVNFNLGS